MPVIGTAGHVQHGKSCLIEALTGTHPDRLPEELGRGLILDLGFAYFSGPGGGPVGVIDVPGHERLIRSLAASAWGLDLALLAVAADEGWTHQSEEHTRVLRAMGVERLVVAVTKSDLAEPLRIEEVRLQALQAVARLGYPDAPSLAVSARTATNIEPLRALLLRSLVGAPFPLSYGPGPGLPLLWVDRVFRDKGAGVAAAGTLRGGPVQRGQQLLLLPQRTIVRARGLRSYDREADRAEPGSRVALNLDGIELEELHKGDCLTAPAGDFWTEREFLIRLEPSAGRQPAPHGFTVQPILKNHFEAEVALGTEQFPARLDRLDEHGLFRVLCERPAALFWNQPCLLIHQGGRAILCGSRVAWAGALERRLRASLARTLHGLPYPMRREDRQSVEQELLGLSPLARKLLSDLIQAGSEGLEPKNLKFAGVQKELAALARSGLAVSLDGAIYYAARIYQGLVRAVLAGRAAGDLLELTQAKQASGLSRKYLIPLLNRMERDGYVKREGDARRIRRLPE